MIERVKIPKGSIALRVTVNDEDVEILIPESRKDEILSALSEHEVLELGPEDMPFEKIDTKKLLEKVKIGDLFPQIKYAPKTRWKSTPLGGLIEHYNKVGNEDRAFVNRAAKRRAKNKAAKKSRKRNRR